MEENSPVSGITRHLYGDGGELVLTKDARAIETTRTIDAAGRVTLVEYSGNPALDVAFAYGSSAIDDEIGRLVAFLKEQALWTATMIVFTSDHGDYLGDHWLGEKDLFHECSVKIPLIVRDPSSRADVTRGTVERRLVEAIDIVPTLVEATGGTVRTERMEGRSLMPFLTGARAPGWRDHVVSEYDYSMREAAGQLGVEPGKARIWMVRTTRWKYLYYEGFRPQLFDLETDPRELSDLGADPMMEKTRTEMREKLFTWMRGLKRRVTISDEAIRKASGKAHEQGILIGWWDAKG
jgi:arylsulfatase A-like enzyme